MRVRRLRRFAALGGFLAVLALLALPLVSRAQAEESGGPEGAAPCPEGPATQLNDQPQAEVRELRGDVAAACDAVASRLDALYDELVARSDDRAAYESDALAALAALETVQVTPADENGVLVEVSNPPESAELEAVTSELTSTVHSDLWAIAGMIAGAFLLVVVFKAVRP